jgi:hypothetical protein
MSRSAKRARSLGGEFQGLGFELARGIRHAQKLSHVGRVSPSGPGEGYRDFGAAQLVPRGSEKARRESICRRALDLLALHAASHGLRVLDALIAATALEAGARLATANVRHYRAIARLGIMRFTA